VELRTYLAIAARYRWQLIVIPLIAALVALAATYVISPRFVGVATVQLIPDEIEPRTVSLRDSAGTSTIALGLRDPTELLAQSVIESVQSRQVASTVSEQLALGALPAPTGWDALKSQVRRLLDDIWAFVRFGYVARRPAEEAAVERVRQALDAELIRGSYFMRISATWRDPQTAAAMANAAVDGITAQTRAVARASATEQREFFAEQRDAARRDVDAARAALVDYSSANGVVGGASLQTAVNALEVARAAERQNATDLADARRRLAITRQQLATISPESVTTTSVDGSMEPVPDSTTRSVTPNTTYQTLQARVALLTQDVAALETRGGGEVAAQLDLQLADARQRLETMRGQLAQPDLGDALRLQLQSQAVTQEQEVAAIEARRDAALASASAQNGQELAEARRRLEVARQQLETTSPTVASVVTTSAETVRSGSEQTTSSPNPIYQAIQRDTLVFEQQVSGLEELQTRLAADVQAREQELRTLTANDGQLQSLAQELALASQIYARRTEEWHNAMLDESRPVAPVRLIDAAVAPLYPAFPIKLYWALIGAAAGLAAALVLVFMRHNTDLSLRSPSEAEEILEMPLLTVLPAGRNGARRGGSR
jgi:uncharacterized protein involved in exopolysaccharide biosynthesis